MDNQEALAKKAEEIINEMVNKNARITDTQIRNFMEAAQKSANYLELKIYLQYQAARMKDLREFVTVVVKYLDGEYAETSEYLNRKGEIAYLFGLMARYKKFKDVEAKSPGSGR
ncbi:MAG TPA: hypothetical protein PLB79_00185 [Thermotogota bacterium]|jgi:hypothetical protein|nr:hypothetical protein [Thermotogaceae bacterium]OQC30574.1 MAG: hypothetical protein BWX67_01700 [Thermotogota bacterium ADurb.Bin062]HNW47081.1 hypothetical protein [Thermotogota bacterium]HOD91873.1 hypothetical protein [Thermotogota bacterium]HOF24339.1 hypothetical protein [Thermotogota bacterium]